MDLQVLVNLGVGVVVPFIGWLIHNSGKLRDDLTAFQLKAAETFVTHADLAEIRKLLEKISDKLDTKQDRQ